MNTETIIIEEPAISRRLFADARLAWLWLPLRLYLGWAWWEAGWHKFIDPKWMDNGAALLATGREDLKWRPSR